LKTWKKAIGTPSWSMSCLIKYNKRHYKSASAELVNEKRIEGISDIRDESDKDGMRLVIELKRDVVPESRNSTTSTKIRNCKTRSA